MKICPRCLPVLGLAILLSAVIMPAAQDRLTAPIDSSRIRTLKGLVHPKARPEADLGLADPAMPISSAALLLKPGPGLEAFLAQQQTPGSPDYHRWLTPDQFGSRFGVSGNDMAKTVAWLESQGLQVNTVAHGGLWIGFSGTAATLGKAFHTEFHRYNEGGKTHFANAGEPAIPAALETLVSGFHGLNNFSFAPMLRPAKIIPDFNSNSGAHYLTPDDVATIYNLAPLYAAGIDGTGQKIAIIGQTDIDLADIRAFRQRFGLPPNDPKVMLFGQSPGKNGDISEADLDLEWSGAVARNATIIYVNSTNVVTSSFFAIDGNLAPVMSLSYSFGCELENTPDFRIFAQQANAQGITWVIASGDSGAASCDFSSPTPQATKGRVAAFPATLPEVTAIGGTTFSEGTGTYWSATNSANGGSALSYIPEVAWNDSVSRNQLSSTGGGASYFYPKPFWQSAPGVPDDGARDIPDVSFAGSPDHDGYMVQTLGVTAVFGGTSVGTPVFAGMLGLLNQSLLAKNVISQAGLGNINPALYRMAQSTTDVYHDVTGGDNFVACAQGTPNCANGALGYAAGPGYDLVTGLGSVDAFHMIQEWNTGVLSTTTLTATPLRANLNDTVTLTATITSAGTSKPTGAVTFLSSLNSLGTVNLTPGPGATATATLGVSMVRIAEGSGSVSVIYAGDGVVGGSGASATVNLLIPASGSLVIPSIDPNPVYQFGASYVYTVSLQEAAGVATKLTGFTLDGVTLPLTFFPSTTIPAFGFLQITLGSGVGPVPTAGSHVFGFTGADANGRVWSQSVTAVFLPSSAPSITPSILLTSLPATVLRNTAVDPACQWAQELTVQERSGYLTTLSQFSIGSTNMNSQIQPIFGTTRLAPYGTLYGTLCFSAATVTASKTLTLVGTGEVGQAGSVATATYASAPAVTAAFGVSAQSLVFSVPDSTQNRTAAIDLTFTGGDAVWTVANLPANLTTAWLTVSSASGEGPGRIIVKASAAGLSNGVYRAFLTFQATNAFPQAINVPVTLVVGGTSPSPITEISNAASLGPAGAPGAQMRVFGLAVTAAATQARRLPLPLNLAGISATVNGVSVPLYSVAPGQVTFQVPYETAQGTAVLAINTNGQIAWREFPVAIAAPGIFTDLNGFVKPSPATQAGQQIAMFITGDGDVTPTLATGASPPNGTAASRLPHPRLAVTVTVGGTQAKIGFTGIPAGLAGVTQINFTVPPGTPVGVQPVVVTVGGVSSPPANLMVTP